ncbi:MAG: hypothetical protein J6H20_07615 [Pyramidobacter sp.]|nr:hypothetical protein [Schwartzia sp. (in: firmicutes)]MBP3752476.1 hypothetical protein [Pyramidobacter sp.]
MVKDPQAINPDVLYNLEMSMRSNEMEGLVYTEEEKELFRSACTSEEHLDAVIKDYLKKALGHHFKSE